MTTSETICTCGHRQAYHGKQFFPGSRVPICRGTWATMDDHDHEEPGHDPLEKCLCSEFKPDSGLNPPDAYSRFRRQA